jgi:zinc protease
MRLEVRLIFKNIFRLAILLLLFFAFEFTIGATRFPTPIGQSTGITYPIVKRDALLNGLQLMTLEKGGTGTITLRFRVSSGALFDLSGKGGLAYLTAGMLLKGGGGLTAKNVEDTVEQSGIRINIGVNWDATDIELSGPTDALDTMFDILGRLVTSPNFDQKELDTLIAQRIAALQTDPANDAEVLNQKAAELIYGSHPFGRPARGTAESLKQIKREDLLYYHRKFYLANNSMLFAAGDLTSEAVTKLARTKLGSMKKGEKISPMFRPPEPQTSRRVLIIEKPEAATLQALISQNGISRRAKDYLATLVLSEVLRDRLTKQVNQEVAFTFEPRIIEGPLTISLKSPGESFLNSITRVLDVLNDLQAQTPSSDQVETAKSRIISRYAELIKSNPAECLFEVELYGLGRDYMITFADRVNAITAGDVQQAAKQHLKPQTAAIIISGNTKALENDLKKLGNVTTTP